MSGGRGETAGLRMGTWAVRFPRMQRRARRRSSRPRGHGRVRGVAAAHVGIRPSTAKRHLADLRARFGLTTEQLIYVGRASGRLVVPSVERH